MDLSPNVAILISGLFHLLWSNGSFQFVVDRDQAPEPPHLGPRRPRHLLHQFHHRDHIQLLCSWHYFGVNEILLTWR